MKAEKNKVVTFHYHLTDETGAKVDSSHDRAEPLTILFGHGQIIPGLEQAMDGHEPGDKFDVSVPPEQGYGERREDFTQRVPKKYFRDADHLKPGDATVLSVQGGGYRQVVVLKVGSSGRRGSESPDGWQDAEVRRRDHRRARRDARGDRTRACAR